MNKVFVKIKELLPIFGVVATVLFLILLFTFKDKLNQLSSELVQSQASSEVISNASAYVDSAFNYSKYPSSYQATFLEFGATGCSACRQMESVMEEVKKQYPEKVNVVFLNILKPESQTLMKYFGVAAIPTQLLLDKEAKEFFRHNGFYSTEELLIEMNLPIK
jgi:thioredoxin 1